MKSSIYAGQMAVACALLAVGCSRGDASETPDAAAAAQAAPAEAGSGGGAASQVTVRGVSGRYSMGDYFVHGEVVNGSDAPVYEVELAISYQDQAGRVLSTDEGAAMLMRVEPGGTAPFVDTHYSAPEGIARAVVTVKQLKNRPALEYRPLAITGVSARTGITGVIVTGQARNDTGRPISSAKLVTSFRNAAGEVVGVYFDYPVIGGWQPGRTVDFTVETMDETLAGHAVTVQGEGHARP